MPNGGGPANAGEMAQSMAHDNKMALAQLQREVVDLRKRVTRLEAMITPIGGV